MHLHQIIENTFGKNIYFRLKDNETEETTKSHIIEQGYAICHDGFKSDGSISYSVLPLSPSGGYYIVANKILENIDATHKNLKMTMSYDERAVDKFGLSPIISFCPPGTRVFYNNYIGLRQIEPTESDQILTYNYLNDFMDQSGWRLCTAKTGPDMTAKGLWDTTLMLGHEVVLFDNNTSEEVIIDETVETSLIRVGETAKSLYTINTNLTENDLLNSTDKKLFINFY